MTYSLQMKSPSAPKSSAMIILLLRTDSATQLAPTTRSRISYDGPGPSTDNRFLTPFTVPIKRFLTPLTSPLTSPRTSSSVIQAGCFTIPHELTQLVSRLDDPLFKSRPSSRHCRSKHYSVVLPGNIRCIPQALWCLTGKCCEVFSMQFVQTNIVRRRRHSDGGE